MKPLGLIVIFVFNALFFFGQNPIEIPGNQIDDDGDGLIDCADPDLAALKECYVCGYDSIAWKTITPEPGFNKGIAIKFTNSDQHFTVPAGVTSIKVKAWGAGGGGGYTMFNVAAGAGGYTFDQFSTSPGEIYVVVTGGGGWVTRATNQTARSTYGFGGSGNSDGAADISETGSGGGLSGIFLDSVTQTNARVIAGGGGGIGDAGGYDETSGGNGNTPLSGGYLPLTGQNAIANSTGMGGGGGGYFGGISGIHRFFYRGTTPAGGEGGAGFKYNSNGSILYTPELNINPPAMTDVHYLNGVGVGNDYNMTVGAVGDIKTGGNGLVVIEWFEPTEDLTITATKDSICKGDTLTLTASGQSLYLWSPSATLSSDTAKVVIASPTTNTLYQVISNYNNCKDTAHIQIVIRANPTLTVTHDSSICNGSSLQISAEGAATYSWSPSTGLSSTSGASVTASPTITREYYVVGTDNHSCKNADSLKIIVNPLPTAAISGTAAVCKDAPAPNVTFSGASGTAPYTFIYTINGGLNQTVSSVGADSVITVSVPTATVGSFVYTLISVQDASSTVCSQMQTGSATITINPLPAATITGTTSVCQNGTSPIITFTGASGIAPYTFTYSINDGANQTVNSTGNTAAVLVPTTALGTYIYSLVSVQDASSTACSQPQTGTATITVNPYPIVNFTATDTFGCSPLCISFQSTAAISSGSNIKWFWDLGDGSTVNNSQIFDHCFTNNSVFLSDSFNVTLSVTSDSGCVSTGTKNNYVTVYPNPKAVFTVQPQTTTITNPVISIADLSEGVESWNWNFGDTQLSILSDPLSHKYADTGTYTITLITDNHFGCDDTTRQTIIVDPDFTFYIPNSFTPNEDGINDTFTGNGIFIKSFQMSIFDRWGNLIFLSEDINKPWDGRANHGSDIALQDVYVYSINVTDFKNKKHNYKGIVTLIK